MSDPIHFSERIKKVLAHLTPHTHSGNVSWPPDLPNAKSRITKEKKKTEKTEEVNPLTWLRDIASQIKNSDQLAIIDNIAFTTEISWVTNNKIRLISEVHAQALILEDISIDDAIMGIDPEGCQYLRADFEPTNLGILFPDPMAHVHAQPKKEPRFSLSASNTVPHIDFIELILRNYARNLWMDWAGRVWDMRISGKRRTLNENDPKTVILQAFANSLHSMICTDLADDVSNWKKALISEKRNMTSFVHDDRFDVMNY